MSVCPTVYRIALEKRVKKQEIVYCEKYPRERRVKSENGRLNNALYSGLVVSVSLKEITVVDKTTLSKIILCVQKFNTEFLKIGVLNFVCKS